MVKSFKDFKAEAGKPEKLDEVIIPAGATPGDDDDQDALKSTAGPTDEAGIPALFATIHHQSDRRPNGYTEDDIWQMNHDANAHLPELQAKMRADRDAQKNGQ